MVVNRAPHPKRLTKEKTEQKGPNPRQRKRGKSRTGGKGGGGAPKEDSHGRGGCAETLGLRPRAEVVAGRKTEGGARLSKDGTTPPGGRPGKRAGGRCRRSEEGLETASPWYRWGPYLSERAWGTVREDYSADGDAWAFFPHDHARSRAYRWNEDGMAGLSDLSNRLCLGLALWNGRDPILKERMFGLTNQRGQPRRGRQGVLVVPRRGAQPRLAALALPLSPGRLPVRPAGRGERSTLEAGARVRAPRHGRLRRRPLLDRRGPLRQGRPDRHPDAGDRPEHGPGRGDAARPADTLVPQHLGVGSDAPHRR